MLPRPHATDKPKEPKKNITKVLLVNASLISENIIRHDGKTAIQVDDNATVGSINQNYLTKYNPMLLSSVCPI